MARFKTLFVVVAVALLASAALAQNPTGTITGNVTDGKEPLPGVTITATSASLQGVRTAVTAANGDYIFRLLPPGDYALKFELAGFQTLDTTVKVSAAQTVPVNAVMPLSKIAEEITVTGSMETISTTSTASVTVDQNVLEELPVPRDLYNAVALTPQVSTTGPSGNITISGAMSYENLFLINGVVVNENVRGQATNLFIEDAIQETTTSTSGISAEYGRFSGGMVNMLTKSGGNEFHGSFRTNFDKDVWIGKTPLTTAQRSDTLNKTYEATLGGKLLTDKLWFFAAGRSRKTTGSDQTRITNIPFGTGQDEKRWEGKLTFSLTPEHRIVGSYIERNRDWTNYYFPSLPIMDLASIYDRSIPEDLLAINYSGVLSDNFFVEGQFSQRHLTFKNSGSQFTDLIKGTVVYDNTNGYVGGSAIFCGVCEEEKRDNKDYLAKASWFLTTPTMGSHDLVFGVDQYQDHIMSVNHQSGSDYWFSATEFGFDGQNFYPIVYGDGSADIDWYPILKIGKGTDFKMQSAFVNDRWRLNNNWSFNVGFRYDKNDGKNSIGETVAKDSKISPRLGVTWDPKGDGDMTVSLTAGQYVTTIAGTGNVADQSPQAPATFLWGYYGPNFNTPGQPRLDVYQVLQGVFDWFFNENCDAEGNCGTSTFPDYGFQIPGYNRIIKGSLRSPYAQELAASFSKRLGTKGMVRLDYIHRTYDDLYETRVDQSTGQVTVVAFGKDWGEQDLGYIQNSKFLERKYDGFSVQANYRLHDRLTLGGNYTLSWTKGNTNGETSGSGPVSTSNVPNYYPEYQDVKFSNPSGYLATDQRHRARVFAIWDVFNTKHNRLNLSLMQSYLTGTPYGAVGAVRSYYYVTNPGYVNRPSSVTYYFTGRDTYRTEDVTSTDLAVNYSFMFKALGADMEVFIQPEVQNVFNEHAVTSVNTTVRDNTNASAYFARFNPFTDTPKECPQGTALSECKAMGANWQLGPSFGKPTGPTNYQTPRTFRVSVGFRF